MAVEAIEEFSRGGARECGKSVRRSEAGASVTQEGMVCENEFGGEASRSVWEWLLGGNVRMRFGAVDGEAALYTVCVDS